MLGGFAELGWHSRNWAGTAKLNPTQPLPVTCPELGLELIAGLCRVTVLRHTHSVSGQELQLQQH